MTGPALRAAKLRIALLEEILADLLGPDPTPPPGVLLQATPVGRPAITAAHWRKGPWHCLRLEERTIGYERPRAYLLAGVPRLSQQPDVEKWMRWMAALCAHFHIAPIPEDRPVRVVFHPGLAHTFIAWREVERGHALHPMDADNAVKPTTDGLQTAPYGTTPDEAKKKPRKFGAYVNDTQVVDLLVYRLEQGGAPTVDRLALRREKRRNAAARKKAKALAEAQDDATPEPRRKAPNKKPARRRKAP